MDLYPGHDMYDSFCNSRSTVITARSTGRFILSTTCAKIRRFVLRLIFMQRRLRMENSSGPARAIHSIQNQRKK
jgi:hypothetical protein